MIRLCDLRGSDRGTRGRALAAVLPRAGMDIAVVIEQVRPLVEAVRRDGHAELVRQAAAFDGASIGQIRVPAEALDAALAELDPDVRRSLEESIGRLRQTCAAELPSDVVTQLPGGAVVCARNVPIGRVGLYVPGAVAPLVSSVVMNVVPAQVAGVSSLALASPAQRDHDGLPHPTILAACALLGVGEVYAAGGAGAIAMFAYGYSTYGYTADGYGTYRNGADGHGDSDSESGFDSGSALHDTGCAPVDLVTGPANIYGMAAKRLVRGIVAIDSEAGPTEIMVLADDSADPGFVAADLISQAEHDTLAASVLVTDSEPLADAVRKELDRLVPQAKHSERVRTALTGVQSAIVLVDDLHAGLDAVNAYAPEHLEVQTRDAATVAAGVKNAGAVFVGPHTPVSLGDYCAGSNHVLPTGAAARHSSGLSVRTFLKTMQVVEYPAAALEQVAEHVLTLAAAEDLPSHGDAVRIRLGAR